MADVENLNSSESDSDDEPLAKMVKRSATQSSSEEGISNGSTDVQPTPSTTTTAKPLTAFAHFFNDTQQSIRNKNENATFEEVSRIVMMMWESLDANSKLNYQKREEEDKRRLEESVHKLVPTLLKKSEEEHEQGSVAKTDSDHKPSISNPVTVVATPIETPAKKPVKLISLDANNMLKISTTSSDQSSFPAASSSISTDKGSIKLGPTTTVDPKPNGAPAIVNTQSTIQHINSAEAATSSLLTVRGITIISKPPTNVVPVTSTKSSDDKAANSDAMKVPIKIIRVMPSGDFTKQQEGSPIQIVIPKKTVAQTEELTKSGHLHSTAAKVANTVHGDKEVKMELDEENTTTQGTVATDDQEDEDSQTAPENRPGTCRHTPCNKLPTKSRHRDDGFCSSKCLVDHCSERFQAWVASRKTS